MTGFDCILIPLDGSERAESALVWAPLLQPRRVRLLRICPPDEEEGAAAAEDYLAQAAARSEAPGATIDARVLAGDPAERIVAEAADANLILMSTRGAGEGGRRLFGSVADRVSRHAPVPTMLLRAGRAPIPRAPLQRVVVPLDGSSAAERAFPLAARIAAMLGAPIQLIAVAETAAHPPEDDAARSPAPPGETRRSELHHYLQRHAQSSWADALDVQTEVRAGQPGDELLAAIRPGDLLVATTHGRGAARRWQIGRVSEALLRYAPAPIVLVRADGG